MVIVHLWKEGLDETQAAIDFISVHQLDCTFDENKPLQAEHRLLMGN
jgi:hypothetical protein